ncbi:MAG TPA: hypothetical protein VHW24_04365 [Bryobacteraceae bacterium]|nr:hypothetical protein [Bryobacteraceae bacterium]
MRLLCILALAGALWAGDAPRLFYSRAFPGSKPDYIQVVVDKSGDASYQEAVDDDLPVKFKLTPEEVKTVYDLAVKLDDFKHPLESPLKVAFMGTKTFRYIDGNEKTEVKYNYSEDVTAQALQNWFERMAESARHNIDLERAVKYDHLGVDQALNGIEESFQTGRVVAPEQYLPMLDRVVKNETYMHQARTKAAELAEYIRRSK